MGTSLAPVGTTWSGTYAFHANERVRPTSTEQLCRLVREAPRVKVLGSGHSFNGIADSEGGLQLDLSGLVEPPVISTDRMSVRVSGAMTYGALVPFLVDAGLALANLASLPHITIAGSVSTGTHGSGVHQPGLPEAVLAVQLLTSDGALQWYDRSDPQFDAMVVSLGALGILTRLRLAVEPAYEVRQDAFQGMRWEQLVDGLSATMMSAYSVSVFSRWVGDGPDHILLKSRVDECAGEPRLPHAHRLSETLHPAWVNGESNPKVTEQGGLPGLWSDRLPHFKMGFIPSSGREIQSEFFLPCADGSAAVEAMLSIGARICPALIISEIRAVAPDRQWLSPAHDRDSIAIHLTWRPDTAAALAAVEIVEIALAGFDIRPHWGKVFTHPGRLDTAYPRLDDFESLRRTLDPADSFLNDFITRHVSAAG